MSTGMHTIDDVRLHDSRMSPNVGVSTVAPDDAATAAEDEPTANPSDPDASGDLVTMYEPIVSLERREVVGFHAFARAADQLGASTNDELRALAHDVGRTAEWDWSYRASAFEDALSADLPAALSVFVGIEPETLDVACPTSIASLVAKAEAQLRIFVEFDGPTLLANPAGLLNTVARAREAGWGVVLRGIAQNPSSTALLRLVSPDVVVFDLTRLRALGAEQAAHVLNDCMTYCQQSSAGLLVRSVNTAVDLNQVLAWRATFAQGDLFEPPTAMLGPTKIPRRAIPLIASPTPGVATDPFDAISEIGSVWQSPPRRLAILLRTLEQRCLSLHDSAVVLACQYPALFSGDRVASAADIVGDHTSFVAMLNTAPPTNRLPAAVRVRLPREDPLAKQRILTIVGDDFCAALAARRGNAGVDDDRLDVALTYDPATVASVARLLLARIPAVPPDSDRVLRAIRLRPMIAQPPQPGIHDAAVQPRSWRSLLGQRRRA